MNPRSTLALLAAIGFAACYSSSGRGHGFSQPLGLDAGCDPNQEPDPCAAGGLACTPLLPGSAFSCQLPGAFFACDPSVGCADSQLQCVGGECLQSCTSTADCADPLTSCAALAGGSSFCQLTSCGTGDAGAIWQDCGSGGTCVFLFSDPRSGPQGACLQGGSVAAGGACQYYRGADAGLCAPGLICTVDAAGQNSGVCLPVCDAFADGGPSCASGSSCVESAIPVAPPAISFYDYYNQSGVCAQGCSPDGGGAVDAGTEADAGTPDGGPSDAGATTVDAGAGGPGSGPCPSPTSCTNASQTSTPTFVCLP